MSAAIQRLSNNERLLQKCAPKKFYLGIEINIYGGSSQFKLAPLGFILLSLQVWTQKNKKRQHTSPNYWIFSVKPRLLDIKPSQASTLGFIWLRFSKKLVDLIRLDKTKVKASQVNSSYTPFLCVLLVKFVGWNTKNQSNNILHLKAVFMNF